MDTLLKSEQRNTGQLIRRPVTEELRLLMDTLLKSEQAETLDGYSPRVRAIGYPQTFDGYSPQGGRFFHRAVKLRAVGPALTACGKGQDPHI